MTSARRTIAVVGATGMLGQALCRAAVRANWQAVGLARSSAECCVDATDSRALIGALDSMKPDAIVNTAAQTILDDCERDPGAAYLINARVVAVLSDYSRRLGIKFVQISTDHFFTRDGDVLHDESASVVLLNEYARTKYAGEAFAMACADSLIIRTNLVGFRGWAERPTFTEWLISALQRREALVLFEDFYTSSLDVTRFSSVLFDLLARDASGLLNVGARSATSKAQFALAMAERLGLETDNCKVGSVRSLNGTVRAESLGLNVQKTEKLLGYCLPELGVVIDNLVREYRDTNHAIR